MSAHIPPDPPPPRSPGWFPRFCTTIFATVARQPGLFTSIFKPEAQAKPVNRETSLALQASIQHPVRHGATS